MPWERKVSENPKTHLESTSEAPSPDGLEQTYLLAEDFLDGAHTAVVLDDNLFPPDASKSMRKFTSGEAATLLWVNDSYLRQLSLDGKGPQPELTAGNRRIIPQ